ncbi:MAG: LptA/OstA family protein [Candidatus Marinimicrobia bacterium]|nr:LptA/OstA family protein [Candidatus Neomarinimicrobiota bacterium]
MRYRAVGLLLMAGLACARGAWGQGAAPAPEAVNMSGPTGKVTVITSERLTFEYQAQYALFEENVYVDDADMQLWCDKMTVRFSDENELESIVAERNVRIHMDDKQATAESATYLVATGEIRLDGQPRVQRGRDLLAGDRIIFWRNENRMVCYPRARLVIYSEEGAPGVSLLGE